MKLPPTSTDSQPVECKSPSPNSSIAAAAIQKKKRHRTSPRMVEKQNKFIADKMLTWKGTLKACCAAYAPELNESVERVYQRYLKWCQRSKPTNESGSLITLTPEEEQEIVIIMVNRKLPPYTKNILKVMEELRFVKGAGANNISWSGWCNRFAERWRQFLGRVPDRYKYRSSDPNDDGDETKVIAISHRPLPLSDSDSASGSSDNDSSSESGSNSDSDSDSDNDNDSE